MILFFEKKLRLPMEGQLILKKVRGKKLINQSKPMR
jgi:hypothetical protein